MLAQDTKAVRPNIGKAVWVDAWCGALMNMWNRDFVHAHYAGQAKDFLKSGPDGAFSVIAGERPLVMGQTIVSDSCDFGWMAAWASEMGDDTTLRGLLKHADRHMSPSWSNGGLYYPRNDAATDADGNATMIEPMSGNVLVGYARLNVPDGLWRFYNEPWDASRFAEPALTHVSDDLDVSKAWFDVVANRLEFSLDGRGVTSDGAVVLGNLRSRGCWSLLRDGTEIARGDSDLPGETSGHVDLQPSKDGLLLRHLDPGPGAYVMAFEG
jgi:hypothetical protein